VYNAREHPAMAIHGQIVISYNVNRVVGEGDCADTGAPHIVRSAENYRPRFLAFGDRG
jgi:hypothetical protein